MIKFTFYLLLMFMQAIATGNHRKIFSGGGGCVSGSCSDNFSGSSGTPLATHNSAWTDAYPASGYVVANLQLTGSSTVEVTSAFGTGGAIYSTSTSDTSQAVYKAYSDYSIFKAACVRITPGTTSGYCFYEQSTTSGIVTKNGSFATGMAFSLPSGSDHTVKVSASGTTTVIVTVTVDGGSPQTWTDTSSPLAAGHPGIEAGAGSTIADTQLGAWQDR